MRSAFRAILATSFIVCPVLLRAQTLSSPEANFTVYDAQDSAGNWISLQMAETTCAFVGDPFQFVANCYRSTGMAYSWDFGPDATPMTSRDSIVRVAFSSAGPKQIRLTVTNESGVSDTQSMMVRVFDCTPAIPKDALIISKSGPSVTPIQGRSLWVVPGGRVDLSQANGPGPMCTVYAEAGATVVSSSYFADTIYLKAGATYEEAKNDCEGDVIIRESNTNMNSPFTCSSLRFDYTNAPPYDITWAGVEPANAPDGTTRPYPNPAMNHVTVKLPEGAASIIVRTLAGEAVLQLDGPFASKIVDLDVSRLSSGVYNATIVLRQNSAHTQFVVSH